MAIGPADAQEATLRLLSARSATATICPSEVARMLAGDGGDWRAMMPVVHDGVDELVAAGTIRLSWKAVPMARRAGPYRIGRVG